MKLLSKIYKTATHDVAVHIQNPLHEKELLQKINQVGKKMAKEPSLPPFKKSTTLPRMQDFRTQDRPKNTWVVGLPDCMH